MFSGRKRYMYCRWRLNNQRTRVGIPVYCLAPPHFCFNPKPGSGFLTSYVAVVFALICFRLQVIVPFFDIGGIIVHHVSIFFSYSIISYLQEYCRKLASCHWCSYRNKRVQTILWESTHLKSIFTSTYNTNFTLIPSHIHIKAYTQVDYCGNLSTNTSFIQGGGGGGGGERERLWCITPLLTVFQLYRGGQLYWWRKPEYQVKTNDLRNISHNVVSSTPRLSGIRTHNVSSVGY